MNEDSNPYLPPKSNVQLVDTSLTHELLSSPNKVTVGAGFKWLAQSWSLVIKDLGIWVLIALMVFVLNIIFSLIPLVGSLLSSVLSPVFMGGLCIGIRAADQGKPMQFESLFAGFKTKLGPLASLGAVNLLATIVLVVVFLLLVGIITMVFSGRADQAASHQSLYVVVLVALSLVGFTIFFILNFMVLLATPLVALHELSAFDALKLSGKACLVNFLSLFVFSIFALLLIILGMLPFMLGLLIVVPMLYVSFYKAYQGIFLK